MPSATFTPPTSRSPDTRRIGCPTSGRLSTVGRPARELRRDIREQELGERGADTEADGGEQAEESAEPPRVAGHAAVSGDGSRWNRVYRAVDEARPHRMTITAMAAKAKICDVDEGGAAASDDGYEHAKASLTAWRDCERSRELPQLSRRTGSRRRAGAVEEHLNPGDRADALHAAGEAAEEGVRAEAHEGGAAEDGAAQPVPAQDPVEAEQELLRVVRLPEEPGGGPEALLCADPLRDLEKSRPDCRRR
jgi:hypothetical protein